MHNVIRQSVSRTLMVLALGVIALPVIAGGGSEMSEALVLWSLVVTNSPVDGLNG